ncbi:protein misato1-like [Tropilaelaps mercedesae]|uniref:Protein misato1-like n=1 Tax=Tropilaelaps mercedesae TaxID=418985 RepID=A0A1V9XLW9_9ACAR|nr:protein misato1-like [Tropilaelaps mercedesae]
MPTRTFMVLITNRFDADNPQQPFNIYNQGEDLWAVEGEEFGDRVRWFAEDCDHLIGFNIVADVANGFSGFMCNTMDYIRDAFRGKTSVVWNLFDTPGDEKSLCYRSINSVLAYHKLHDLADLILPLAVTTDGIGRSLRKSSILLDLSSFTGGAVLALQIDSILSSCKLKADSKYDFLAFPQIMAEGQKKFAVSSMAIQPTKDSRTECFTPKCATTKQSTGAYVIVRANDELQKDVARICGSNPASTFCASIKHPTKFLEERFCQLASETVTRGSGLISGAYALQNSDTIVAHFNDLLRRKYHANKMHRLTLTQEDVNEAVDGVAAIKECYLS